MMAQRLVLAFVLLVLTGAAHAVNLSASGIGQALIYPYYTVNKDQDTLISVTNAAEVGKAIEVRFVEGYNGRDVLSFVLFISPHDVWTAAITHGANGGAVLKTADTSCTYPAPIPPEGLAFSSLGYDGTAAIDGDTGPHGIARTSEGSIELIVGGNVVAGSATAAAITHVSNGVPGDGTPPGCASLSQASFGDLNAPIGGISGSGSIINVAQGTFFAYNADALQNFTDVNLFNPAFELAPSLIHANSSDGVTPGTVAHVFDERGKRLALHYSLGIDAVSAVFMTNALYNEFFVDAALGANTDWIVTFPTKRFYVDDILYPNAPRAPFVEAFASPGAANMRYTGIIYDREEGNASTDPPDGCGIICPGRAPPTFPYEVNALSFLPGGIPDGAPSGVLGSMLSTNFSAYPYADGVTAFGPAGWLAIELNSNVEPHSLPGGLLDTGEEVTLTGVPATGFMVYNIINTHAQPGLLANYGGLFRHRATMACFGPTHVCEPVDSGAAGR